MDAESSYNSDRSNLYSDSSSNHENSLDAGNSSGHSSEIEFKDRSAVNQLIQSRI